MDAKTMDDRTKMPVTEISTAAIKGEEHWTSKAGDVKLFLFEKCAGNPQDTPGKKVNPSFLYNGTRHMYEEAGFAYVRPKGKNHCVMTKVVEPAG